MTSDTVGTKPGKEEIEAGLIAILENMTSEWDMEFSGAIGGGTCLMGDLEFESIDVVQFIVAIEERFKRRNMPFEELLMEEGRYVDEIKVGDAVEFLSTHL